MSTAVTLDYQPADPAFLAEPWAMLARLRDEDPCHYSPRLKSWVVTRYHDIRAMCLAPEKLSSDRLEPFFAALPGAQASRIGDLARYLALWMVFKDAPEHTRLRRLTAKVFHNRSMQAMRPQIESISRWLLDQLRGQERFDFMTGFAGPLPCLVIMAMLGVPREELAFVKKLSDEIALFIGSSRATPEKYATAQQATHEMADYFARQIELRRAAPRDDLISELLGVVDGDDRLTDDELVATCILLLFAGHETTTNHIANGLLSLIRFPDQMHKLRADPGLAAAAVEELLRYDGPSGAQVRIAGGDYPLHGKTIGKGDRVFMLLHAANRDPRAYADPDRLDLERDGVPHLTFGFGPHICLGFPLARLEGQIALPAVLATWRSIELDGDPPQWIDSMVFRGMKSLQVRVKA